MKQQVHKFNLHQKSRILSDRLIATDNRSIIESEEIILNEFPELQIHTPIDTLPKNMQCLQ
jgi:hypothetical protein